MSNYDPENPVTVLSEEESLELLAGESFGRLVVRRASEVDIFPINYVVDGSRAVYFRTAEGAKLFTLSLNSDVLLETDFVDQDNATAWSVVVRGSAVKVDSASEYAHADALPLKPLVPTLKYNYVRVDIEAISGRRFRLGEEPERF
ncbi:pyridoxamine 5'-phosphate oxidase family protein [Corynebacterium uberis]|uniref:pyridoxamine 5'-phosphate oxidase family protein n=1 Tax=Corynebacterium TaxID=1716 RepID=UPI001D0B11D0|nr:MULTISPECIES: pyridoxamine 5'-phosphate oxidase family protein [Corynebacterium]MCZ9310198.1 pyridoxamine 5'-phosphate oxidase family protein [Corynebacterium sp. c6VSa_13]UDL73676.1 pyridoxamine 5'-phosphate oxidase family protein [Corynebacterium uberis]UDL75442.1 pyridoxamine 5'-phosphate oxidase family protein [Corynebacterium uberis]UDL77655.1 pyridoxamine 5'-phosphate oxidase family protein [Corynebacterium uberis]UDL79940.1 pyridoxamine 5'-phosphate oxidase family protein [Corynebact